MFGMGGFGGCGGRHGGQGFGPPWARIQKMQRRFGAMLSDLDLNDDQLERLAKLKAEGILSFMQFKATISEPISQIAKELGKDQIDKNKVKEIAQQIRQKRSDFGDGMLDRIITFCEVLTPEQRRKLKLKAIKRFLGIDSPLADAE